MSPPLVLGLVAGVALTLTAVLTPVVRGAAIGMGLVRSARGDRWHTRPTPAVGGVAVYVGFGAALALGFMLLPAEGPAGIPAPQALLPVSPREGLLAAVTTVFLLGVADDLLALNPLQKLAGQTAAAVLLVLSGIGVWLTGIYVVDAALSLLWFVAMTNAMNLLDNMDGLAAGVAAIAGGYLGLLFLLEGETGYLMLSVAFSASLLGFLAHNYPPARIFMGDSGSLFLGLFLAGLSLSPTPGLSRSLFAVVAAPALVLAIPILDTTLVTVGRVLEGRPISQGGRDHTSHRLVELGVSEERALWILWSLALLGGGIALLLRTAERGTAYLFGGMLLALLVLVGGYLLSVRFRALEREEREGLPVYDLLLTLNERYPILPFVLDALLVGLAYYAAYVIRWTGAELPAELPYFARTVAVVVAAKMVGFAVVGIYGSGWHHFGLDDGLRVVRANLLASLLATVALLLVARVGLSRGVMAVDFLACTVLLLGARLSFRFMEGATRRWSVEGTPVVVLGDLADAELAVRELRRVRAPRLRAVAVAAPGLGRSRSRFGSYPVFGGDGALERAIRDTGAGAVLLVDRHPAGGDDGAGPALERYLSRHGAVDVFELRLTLSRLEGGPAGPVPRSAGGHR